MNENDPNQTPDEPKIVVDDDYKSRVEQEKEQLRKEVEASHQAEDEMQMPPASFPMLVTTLATQALSNLGQIPDPFEGKPVIRKSLARHFIDTLVLLEEKTKGNLTSEENELLGGTIHQLRMVFVAAPDKMPESDGDEKPKSSSIELPS